MKLDTERLANRLKVAGYNKKTASEAIGMNRTWLYSVMAGAEPRAGSIRLLADLLDCDIEYLYGEQDEPRRLGGAPRPSPAQSSTAMPRKGSVQIPLTGVTQAGAWLEVDELYEPSEFITIDVDPNFPNARKMVYEVRGDSMNLAGILENDRIVCWDVHDYPFELRDGDDVVVERARDGGHLREWTVKRFYRHPDGMQELRPISSNKAHKSFRIMPDDEMDNGETIAIIAIVEDIIRKHRRRIDL